MSAKDRFIMDEVMKHSIKQFLASVGRAGGKKTAERGSEYYRNIQKKSVASRNSKKKENGA